jgi:hypothetical protein
MVTVTVSSSSAVFEVEGLHQLLGTDVPGLFAAGTFYYHGELVFWDVSDPGNTIIVSMDHERYKKLIVQVDNPEMVVDALQGALRR